MPSYTKLVLHKLAVYELVVCIGLDDLSVHDRRLDRDQVPIVIPLGDAYPAPQRALCSAVTPGCQRNGTVTRRAGGPGVTRHAGLRITPIGLIKSKFDTSLY